MSKNTEYLVNQSGSQNITVNAKGSSVVFTSTSSSLETNTKNTTIATNISYRVVLAKAATITQLTTMVMSPVSTTVLSSMWDKTSSLIVKYINNQTESETPYSKEVRYVEKCGSYSKEITVPIASISERTLVTLVQPSEICRDILK